MSKILMVDSNNKNVTSMCSLVSRYLPGSEIIPAGSYREGVQILKSISIDTIILDIDSKDSGGLKVCKKFKSNTKTKHIPVMLITAKKNDPEGCIKALSIGADAYLKKPVDERELSVHIKVMLHKKKEEDLSRKKIKDLTKRIKDYERQLKSELETRFKDEVALWESEERFRRLTENAQDIIYRMSLPDGKYEYISKAVLKITGYSPREYYKSPSLLEKIMDPEWKKYYKKEWKHLLSGKMDPTYEYKIINKSGKEKWLYQRNVMIRDKKNKPVAIEGIVTDITERKRTEEVIHKSEVFLNSIIDQSPGGIIIFDDKGYAIRFNKTSYKLFGVEAKDVLNKYNILKDNLLKLNGLMPQVESVFRKGKTVHFTMKYQSTKSKQMTNTGSTNLIVETILFPLKDTKRKITNVIGQYNDITDIKKTETPLRLLSSRQKAILTSVPDIIMEVDNNKIYTWANKAGYKFFGDDVIGKKAAYYFEGKQETYEIVKPLFRGDENTIYVESWQRRKDGEKRLLAWWCRVLKDDNNKVTGALSTARDITQQKLIEEELKKKEAQQSLVLSSLPMAFYIAQPFGDFGGTWVSDQIEQISGFPTERFVSDSNFWASRLHPDDKAYALNEFEQLKNKESIKIEYRWQMANGEYKWIQDYAVLILSNNNKPKEIIETWLDINEKMSTA